MHVQLEMVKNVPLCKSYKNGTYGLGKIYFNCEADLNIILT